MPLAEKRRRAADRAWARRNKHKLTAGAAAEMRRLYFNTAATIEDLCAAFDCSRSTVYRVIREEVFREGNVAER